MMRKVFSVALMALAFGVVQSANAGVTIDVVFQDATSPTGITINSLDAASHVGPGCAFGPGYYNNSVTTGRCMDVMLETDNGWATITFAASVAYDSDNGLAVGSVYKWSGVATTTKGVTCDPVGGVTDTGSRLQSFDCLPSSPVPPPSFVAGTYRVGTIVWDTSATTSGTETIAAVINDLINGMGAVINGNIHSLTSADIVVGTHVLTIIPEPGTASLLGLGLVGLILAGRRRRA